MPLCAAHNNSPIRRSPPLDTQSTLFIDVEGLVNPLDREGMADAIWRGLAMKLGERKERSQAMMATPQRNDAQVWRDRFIADLAAMRVIAR